MIRLVLATVLSVLLSVSAIAGSPLECVCKVSLGHDTPSPRDNRGGSGTLIANNGALGLVLTCRHVAVSKGDAARIAFPGYNVIDGKVVFLSDNADLALILTESPGDIRPAQLGLTDRGNAPFYFMGYPSYDREHLNWQKSDKIYELSADALIVGCAPVPGMSGGPVFDARGYLVGVLWGYRLQGDYFPRLRFFYTGPDQGFAEPSSEIMPFLFDFIEESENMSIVPAALLASVVATLPANAPREWSPESEPYNVMMEQAEDAAVHEAAIFNGNGRFRLFQKLRPQSEPKQRSRPQSRRTQRIDVNGKTQPQPQQQNCPGGTCPRGDGDGGCEDGQCKPRTERVDGGFRFFRQGPRRELEIEVPGPSPEPTPAEPKDEGAPIELEIQVQDLFPVPQDKGEERSIVVNKTEEPGKTEYASLGALVGLVIAAYRKYVDA